MLKKSILVALGLLALVPGAEAKGFKLGSGFSEGNVELEQRWVEMEELAANPDAPTANRLRYYAKDDAGTTKIYTIDSAGTVVALGAGGGGSSIIFDIGDDGGNDSIALGEIATSGDTNAIFTESAADKLLIDLSKNWPKSDTAADLTCTNCIGAPEIDGASLESEIEAVADLQDFQGAVTDAQVPDTITINLSTKATNLVGGNNSTLLGSIPYQSNTDTTTLLAPNVSTTKDFLTQTGSGINGAAPVWTTISASDLPSTLTGETITNSTLDNTDTITVKDANFTIQDDGGTTRQGQFQLSGISAGNTRTLTWPDFNGTIATLAGTEALTNKTVTSAASDPADAGVLRLGNAEVIGWEKASTGTDSTITMDSNDVFTSSVPINATTGFRIGNAAASGKILIGNGTNYVASTPTYPNASVTSGKVIISDGTNYVSSTSTIPTSAGATANKALLSDGTNYVLSTPTFPNASATSLKHIRSDGTNWIASTATYSDTPSTAGKVLTSDGTNWITSTPTFPNASATSGKVIKSDGTNWTASTETYAAPGTSGNVLTSDGTNWTSAAAPGGSAVTVSVAQTSHGFVVGDIIRNNGTANTYTKAKADSAANAEVSGIVTTVTDVNNFTYTVSGLITAGVPTDTAGTVYFLSPSSAGAITSTEPSTAGQISKPLLIVQQSATKALFFNFRGATVASGSSATAADLQVFTASGTWTKPSGTPKLVQVYLTGAGGGGGGGGTSTAATQRPGGGGGGGGSGRRMTFLASDLGSTETVTIGAGGTGGASVSNGTAGGSTTFGAHLTGYGGGFGSGVTGTSTSGGGGGAGMIGAGGNAGVDTGGSNGLTMATVASTNADFAGGQGGNLANGGSSLYGGGAGAGSGGNQSGFNGGTSMYGGGGGGCGGATGDSNQLQAAGDGGATGTNVTRTTGGGGTHGTAANGSAGAAGTSVKGGQGGGGGAPVASGTGFTGGIGGVGGGGGGGGGCGGTGTGGTGGAGGGGNCYVWTTY